jgi:hypothetical protein
MDLQPFYGHLSSPAGQRISISFETSLPASIAVVVSRRGRVITRGQGRFGVGQHTLRLGRPPAPGSYLASMSGSTELNRHVLHNCAEALLNVVRNR